MGAFDISRNAFNPAKHYASVRMQQGRVLTDDDWNENERIENEERRRSNTEIVGAYGSPDNGFKIINLRYADRFIDFDIMPGVIYLGGLRLEMDLVPDENLGHFETFNTQRDWLQMYHAFARPSEQQVVPPRYDLVYLEAWQQGVSAVEDNELFEHALGGPDTTTRTRYMRRVNLAPNMGFPDCFKDWVTLQLQWQAAHLGSINKEFERRVDTIMQVGFTDTGSGDDLCEPRIAGSYLGAENQAIRVQLVDATHFTWGFDNASPYYRVQVIDPTTVELLDLPKDQSHWPLIGENVEFLAWSALLPNGEKVAEIQGHMTKLGGSYNPNTHLITLTTPIPTTFNHGWFGRPDTSEINNDGADTYIYMRVWHRGTDMASDPSIPIVAGPITLGNTGLTVTFTGNDRVPGDYWVIAARPETPEELVPWRLENEGMGPMGFRRFFAPLAVIKWDLDANNEVQGKIIRDCRKTFRPLTDQETCCTFHVGDGMHSFGDFNNLQEAIDNLPEYGGKICVLPGVHLANASITSRYNITIQGCGLQSIILAQFTHLDAPIIHIANSFNIDINHLTLIALQDRAIEVIDTTLGLPSVNISISRNLIMAVRNGIYVHTDDAIAGDNNVYIGHNIVVIPNLATAGVGIFSLADGTLIEWNRVVVVPVPVPIPEGDIPPVTIFEPCDCEEEDEQQQQAITYATQAFNQAQALHGWELSEIFVALGGIQIGGSSERVRLLENMVVGGCSNGITLGHLPSGLDLPPQTGTLPAQLDTIHRQALTTGDINLASLTPEQADWILAEFKSTLYEIQIERNTVQSMGLAGVGTICFFQPRGQSTLLAIVDDLLLERNTVQTCAQQIPTTTRNSLFIGYGGVVLAQLNRGVITDNTVQDCGKSKVEPICGIYIMSGEKFSISRNRILNNGPEFVGTLTTEQPVLGPVRAGTRGGIFIPFALKTDALQVATEEMRSNGLPAAMIHDNIVVQPLGQALYLFTMGPVSVEGNNFTSQDQDLENSLSLAAATVYILNMGVAKDAMYLAVEPTFSQLPNTTQVLTFDPGDLSVTVLNLVLSYLQYLPSGKVLFNDNQVTFDQRDLELDMTMSSCAIFTLDDISFCSNQLECLGLALIEGEENPELVPLDMMMTDGLLSGYTVRTADNRFQEGFTSLDYSLISTGAWNTTTGNQSSRCLLTYGDNQIFETNFQGILIAQDCELPGRVLGERMGWNPTVGQ